jgi:hypothetical protein
MIFFRLTSDAGELLQFAFPHAKIRETPKGSPDDEGKA